MADSSDIGRDLGEARFRVDRSKVKELARALFDHGANIVERSRAIDLRLARAE